MKKLLLIAFLLGFGAAHAQDILLTHVNGDTLNGDTITYEKYMSAQNTADTNFQLKFEQANVKNNTDSMVLEIKVQRTALNTQPGINDLLCWGGICEDPTPTFQPMRTSLYSATIQSQQIIQGGGSGFAGYYQPRGNYGPTYFKYTFYDVNSQVTPASFVVEFNATQSVGIEEYGFTNNFSISPNPANDYIVLDKLPKELKSNASIEILNIIGKVVSEKAIGITEKAQINVSNLRAGIYFVRLKTDGEYSKAQKLIVK